MFKIFYLSTCGYSVNALETLHNYSLVIAENEINCDIKDNFLNDPDHILIPSDYTSYPKILYLQNSKPIFIGGNKELTALFNIITTPLDPKCKKIPSQRFIDRKTTCEILLKLNKQINKQNKLN